MSQSIQKDVSYDQDLLLRVKTGQENIFFTLNKVFFFQPIQKVVDGEIVNRPQWKSESEVTPSLFIQGMSFFVAFVFGGSKLAIFGGFATLPVSQCALLGNVLGFGPFFLKLNKFKWFQQTLGGYWSEPGTFVRSLDQLFGSRGPLGAPKWP